MSFRLVPKSVTLNDLERRNGSYFVGFFNFLEGFLLQVRSLRRRACGLVNCLLLIVSGSVLGSCLQFTERKTSVLSINTVHLFTRLQTLSSDVARRDVLPSVRRYSLSLVKSRIRSCAILFRVAPPTPAFHWTSASPVPQFHIQIRFPLTQHFSNDITVCRSLLIVGPSLPVDMP